jgi:omega-3 fatty acid desaturase (delta-15 desaturase)
MANLVLSKYGLKPLPQILPRPRTGIISHNNPSKTRFLYTNKTLIDLIRLCKPCQTKTDQYSWYIFESLDGENKLTSFDKFSIGCFRERNWGLKVCAPNGVAHGEEDNKVNGFNGIGEE